MVVSHTCLPAFQFYDILINDIILMCGILVLAFQSVLYLVILMWLNIINPKTIMRPCAVTKVL